MEITPTELICISAYRTELDTSKIQGSKGGKWGIQNTRRPSCIWDSAWIQMELKNE